MEIMFQTSGTCNLKCTFCAYNYLSRDQLKEYSKSMSYDEFVEIANKFMDFGYDTFQMTPTLGEPFIDQTFMDKIEYLETQDRVKRITFFTNFTNVSEDNINRLMKTRKTTMFISIYGWDKETFKTVTKRDKFNQFEKSLLYLKKVYDLNFRSLSFFIRNPEWENVNNKTKSLIEILTKLKPSGEFWDRNNIQKMYWNGNWCGAVPDNELYEQVKLDSRKGLCWYTLIDNIVLPGGDLYLCGACDAPRISKLGNVLEQSLEDIYSKDGEFAKIIESQQNDTYIGSCATCSEHHPVPEDCLKEYKKKYEFIK